MQLHSAGYGIIFRIHAFSENSCARKMCHLLLAGYEDVPSFLNQWKLKRSLIYYSLKIYFTRQVAH